jgi:hypothetical protein
MVFQIRDKTELYRVPNFGGIPNVFFGKLSQNYPVETVWPNYVIDV